MKPLSRRFYARPTLDVTRDLLGKLLVHRSPTGLTSGLIVEAEAYIGEDDPACHAAPGLTARNEPLYGEPGHAYVYLNYGIHYLVNVVTERRGLPAAILIRALTPVEGVELMRRRRARGTGRRPESIPEHELCRGPGNLTRAMGITLGHNRIDLCGDRLFVTAPTAGARKKIDGLKVCWGQRIGINVGMEHPWRCLVNGCRAVSR